MKFLELKDCPHCGTRVLPTSDGLCPNCRRSLAGVLGVQVKIAEDESPQNKEQISEKISGGDLLQKKQQGLKHDAKCPNCGLINPPGTVTCDCGYIFTRQASTQRQVIHRWSTAFVKVAGPISMVICIGLVTLYRPSPGHLLPMSWTIGIFVGTIVLFAVVYGLGALFGYLVWFLNYRSNESEPVTTEKNDWN